MTTGVGPKSKIGQPEFVPMKQTEETKKKNAQDVAAELVAKKKLEEQNKLKGDSSLKGKDIGKGMPGSKDLEKELKEAEIFLNTTIKQLQAETVKAPVKVDEKGLERAENAIKDAMLSYSDKELEGMLDKHYEMGVAPMFNRSIALMAVNPEVFTYDVSDNQNPTGFTKEAKKEIIQLYRAIVQENHLKVSDLPDPEEVIVPYLRGLISGTKDVNDAEIQMRHVFFASDTKSKDPLILKYISNTYNNARGTVSGTSRWISENEFKDNCKALVKIFLEPASALVIKNIDKKRYDSIRDAQKKARDQKRKSKAEGMSPNPSTTKPGKEEVNPPIPPKSEEKDTKPKEKEPVKIADPAPNNKNPTPTPSSNPKSVAMPPKFELPEEKPKSLPVKPLAPAPIESPLEKMVRELKIQLDAQKEQMETQKKEQNLKNQTLERQLNEQSSLLIEQRKNFSVLEDRMKAVVQENANLKLRMEELEEANKTQIAETDHYKQLCANLTTSSEKSTEKVKQAIVTINKKNAIIKTKDEEIATLNKRVTELTAMVQVKDPAK